MRSQLEQAADALFPPEGSRVGNVKFFTAGAQVTGEQLAEQLNRADAEIAAGGVLAVANIDAEDSAA